MFSVSRSDSNSNFRNQLLLALLLLTIAAARILRLEDVQPHPDEIWSIWQGFGSLTDIIRWSPYDWPPLYFVCLSFWVKLVGLQPIALRMLSVFCFMIGVSSFYQILKKHVSIQASTIALLLYGGMAYTVYLSIEIRGYAFMLGLIPLAWWFAQRTLTKPTWYLYIAFSVLISASIYSTYISMFPVIFIYSYIIIHSNKGSRKVIYCWIATFVIFLLMILPLVIHIFSLIFIRMDVTSRIQLPPIHEAIVEWYIHSFSIGSGIVLIFVLLGLLALLQSRRITRIQFLLFFWGVFFLFLQYTFNRFLGFFGVKYSSWLFLCIAAFVAVTVDLYPRILRIFLIGFASFIFLLPFPISRYFVVSDVFELGHHLSLIFTHLSSEVRAKDRILFAEDEECRIYSGSWNFPLALHFPNGLNITHATDDHPRIWFVTADGSPDSPHWETLRRDYVERHFVGPPGCLFRLYERPPDAEGVLFSNGMRFHGAQFLQDGEALPPGFIPQLHEGEGFQVRLWWKVEEPMPQDYSVGTFLFDAEGRVIEEVHGPPDPSYPEGAPWETSRWQVGQLYYEDRQFELPYPLERQLLDLRLAVYYWENPSQRFTAEGVDAIGMLPILSLNVFSW